MYKKIDFNEEIHKIMEKGIATYSGFKTQNKIIVTLNNKEMNTYLFTNTDEYNKFNRKLRKIYNQEMA